MDMFVYINKSAIFDGLAADDVVYVDTAGWWPLMLLVL